MTTGVRRCIAEQNPSERASGGARHSPGVLQAYQLVRVRRYTSFESGSLGEQGSTSDKESETFGASRVIEIIECLWICFGARRWGVVDVTDRGETVLRKCWDCVLGQTSLYDKTKLTLLSVAARSKKVMVCRDRDLLVSEGLGPALSLYGKAKTFHFLRFYKAALARNNRLMCMAG
ncbi:hypothetical protein TSAR_000913 [Trichomalopsis sarcophagae]|uniref:Uncharacterized protein n=1 Tax=Trichomalopsis sarcophagae TaxID=543379 RepID=A0A232EU80_9HYME|nr:hypothetical protein TSAR_000913 [Trichomalopsis sarcophagae]